MFMLGEVLRNLHNTNFMVTDTLGRWVSATEISAEVKELSDQLASLPEGPIGLACSNRLKFLLVVLAASSLNRSIVLFGPQWMDPELNSYWSMSPCVALIADHFRKVEQSSYLKQATSLTFYLREQRIDAYPHGCWVGQYTSGTTGKSKLVIREWEAILNEISVLEHAVGLKPNATFFNMAPPHHSFGFCGGLIWPFVRGAQLFLLEKFYPSLARRVWNSINPDVVYGIPFQYHFLADAPGPEIPSAQWAFSAGAPLTGELRRLVKEKLSMQLTNNYGSTETGTICLYPNMPEEVDSDIVGWPLEGRKITLDTDNQIVISSDGNMRGYFGEVEVGNRFATGDLGELQKDGSIRVLGRKKPVINIGGVKVSIAKVEDVLLRMPEIKEVIVLPESSDGFYQLIKAFIVLHDPSNAVSESHITDHCKRYLSPLEIPRRIVLLDEMPRSETGKLMGKNLADM